MPEIQNQPVAPIPQSQGQEATSKKVPIMVKVLFHYSWVIATFSFILISIMVILSKGNTFDFRENSLYFLSKSFLFIIFFLSPLFIIICYVLSTITKMRPYKKYLWKAGAFCLLHPFFWFVFVFLSSSTCGACGSS
jgi:hypothetical protein